MGTMCSKLSQVTQDDGHGHIPLGGVARGFEEFLAVLDAGSISAAARTLEMPRASLSRRIATLEQRLGVRLLVRGTRSLAKTSAGAELEVRARHILAESVAALGAVRRLDGVPRGLLRISTPPDDERGLFASLVLAFLTRWPEVHIETTATARHVDLAAEGIDVALRAGTDMDAGVVARVLRRLRVLVVGAPGYLQQHGAPQVAADLAGHSCVRRFARGRAPSRYWPLRDGGQVPVSGRIVTNSLKLHVGAALAGHGLALVPTTFASAKLASGALVPVLTDVVGDDSVFAVVYPEKEYLDPKVRAFVDHCVEWFEDLSFADFNP